MNRLRLHRPHIAFLVGVLLLGLVGGTSPALAGPGTHTGHYGVHTLIDNGEYAGAICGYTSAFLDTIKIRRPIVFGKDRTGGVDTQKVGWRFNIEYSFSGTSWSHWSTSSLVVATATDKVNAHFKPRTFHLVNPVKTTYWRVTIDLYWYYPDLNHQNGHANHVVNYYQIGLQDKYQTWCPENQIKTISTPPPPNHSGNYGVHTLIDNGEYAGATCRYHSTSDDFMYKLSVRPPIVFGFDRTAALDSQTVGWRYTIQYTDDNATWHQLVASSIVKTKATDQANAPFQSRSYTFPSQPNHAHYRVVIGMFWYFPNASHQDGKAVHTVANYGIAPDGFPTVIDGVCASTTG